MPLSSLFKRKPAADTPAPAAGFTGDEPPLVAAARVRARRRLIGAVVLLGVGIVGFPLLFETAPRPIPVDIPIEIPRKDAVAPLPMPAPAARTASGVAMLPPALTLPPDAGSELPASAPQVEAPARAEAVPAPVPVPASVPAVPASAAAAKASAAVAAKPAGDAQRARALLEGAAPAAPAASGAEPKLTRFVVQVGAYTDPNALRETRAKVEKLGLKTYTQVIDTEAGKRTRVRIGPFASRDEAAAAVRTLKTAGLPGNILAL
jgi:DedD protein